MHTVGIDVSKNKLDVCWLRDAQSLKVKTRVFGNSRKDIQALLAWLQQQTGAEPAALQVMMEATGIYHEALAYALHEAGVTVYVANPRHAHEFAKSLGTRSKTDRKDSVILARFLASRPHHPWEPEPAAVRELKALLARLQMLETDILREENRLEKVQIQGISGEVLRSVEAMIKALREERARLQRDIDDHLDRHPQLKSDRELLSSIPGVGAVLSVALLALLRSRSFDSARQSAAFVGLIPLQRESGTSVRGRPALSKAGPARLRAKLYMGAVVAARHNPSIKALYQRLLERGKCKMSALGAAMRKLVQIAYGVLKHQQKYDPQWASTAH